MSTELITFIMFFGLMIFLAMGIHIFLALGIVSIICTFILHGSPGFVMVSLSVFNKITDLNLMVIPFFVLMGNLLVHSGIAEKLYTSLNLWLSNVKGGLAVVSLCVCVVLAMTSGFGAGLITMGLVAVPAMLKRNYSKSLSLGSVMSGGVLGDVIPPSLMLIIFGSITRISIGKLFFAAILPGFICAGILCAYILIRSYLQPGYASAAEEKPTWRMRWVSLKDVIAPIVLVVIILGSIFLGIATPSEAAAVGVLGAFLILISTRKLTWKSTSKSLKATMEISGMALWILATAVLFSNVYTSSGVQALVVGFISDLEVNRWTILIIMQIILLVMGMVLDDYAVITIFAPIFMPIVLLLGFNPLWFGVLFILNMQIAYMTPPFGWALILMKGVAPPYITTADIWRSIPPFIAIQLFVLVIVMLFPALTTWLPGLM